ncbi:hypothetical protein U2F10_01070 [Leptothoe sp. EHU-05/26/07-4]
MNDTVLSYMLRAVIAHTKMATERTPVTVLLTAEILEKLRPYQQERDITSVTEAILTILHEQLEMTDKPTPPFSPSPSIYDGVEDGACEVLTEYLGA